MGHNILKDDWEKTWRQIEDTWRQWADQFWEINQNSGRQSEDNWELEETAPQSKTELPQGETNDLETAREPDTTSQTGRQINCHKGRHMNWRQAKSRTTPARLGDNESLYWETKMNLRQPNSRRPLARLGDKCIAIRGNK